MAKVSGGEPAPGEKVETIEYYATDEVPMIQGNIGFFDMIAIWVGAN